MYKVNAEAFDSFLKAVAAANKIGAEVFDSNGNRRWAPAAAPSDKKLRRYKEQLAAFQAQERLKSA